MKPLEHLLELFMFNARWLLAPFYVGMIIVFAGYENFVSRIDVADHIDRPSWMGKVGFTDLKIKLIGSIVAISGIELLKLFVTVGEPVAQQELIWKVVIHATLVISGVLFALMDRIGGKTPH